MELKQTLNMVSKNKYPIKGILKNHLEEPIGDEIIHKIAVLYYIHRDSQGGAGKEKKRNERKPGATEQSPEI